MRHSRARILFATLSVLLIAPTFVRAAPVVTIAVGGDVLKPRSWSLAQLEKMGSAQTIVTTLKNKPYTARGLRLWTVVQAAAPKFDPKIKHPEARFVVLARGKDGYVAAFSWPELMPSIGNKSAFVVWSENGKPLPKAEGTFRLVVTGDQKPMRWVYNLVSLEIYDAKRLSSR